MTKTKFYRSVTPSPLDTFEQAERFAHRDLESADLNPARVWAEAELVQQQLAFLLFHKERGRLLILLDGRCIHEDEWLRDRLQRLRAILRRRAA